MIIINSVLFTQSVENINNQEVPELPYLFLWRNVNVIKACSVEFTEVVIKLLRVNKNRKYVHCNFIK